MDDNPAISTRYWILALAVFVGFAFLFVGRQFGEVYGGLGILGIASQKTADDVTALRQEVTSQRETIEALKASLIKSVPSTPTSASTEAPSPAQRDAQPKAKPRR